MGPRQQQHISPARLSSLSTTTLTQILELTRSHQTNITPPPSLIPNIRNNLTILKRGIDDLEADYEKSVHGGINLDQDELESKREILEGLQKQFERLVDLVDGLGVEVEQFKPVRPEPNLDDDSTDGVPLADLSSLSQSTDRLIPSVRINMEDHEALDLQRDEEEMKRANADVMQLQHQMMDQQDDTLDALSKAISRQRDLSLTISSELELHHNLLNETDDALDRTDSNLRKARTRLEKVSRKARDNGSTCIIVGLVVVLLILIVILK